MLGPRRVCWGWSGAVISDSGGVHSAGPAPPPWLPIVLNPRVAVVWRPRRLQHGIILGRAAVYGSPFPGLVCLHRSCSQPRLTGAVCFRSPSPCHPLLSMNLLSYAVHDLHAVSALEHELDSGLLLQQFISCPSTNLGMHV